MEQNKSNRDYEYTTLMNMLRISVSKHQLNEHFSLVWANDFYYQLIGYSKEEYEQIFHNQCDQYYKNKLLGIDDQEEWARIGEVVTNALRTGQSGYTLTSRMRKKDGSYVWVQMGGTFVDEYIDGYQVSYTTMTDITETIQQQIEQTVAYDNLPGFVVKLRIGPGLQAIPLDANSRFDEFFGADSREFDLKDTLFQENLCQNKAVILANQDQLLAGKPAHFVVRMQNQHGEDKWLQVNAARVSWQGEDPVYLAIFIDITNETELRQMQEQLEQQARDLKDALRLAEHANRAKSDFLSHMSHDIRTPMNAIVGMTDIAKAHIGEPEKMLDCLNKITLSSQHLLGLINDVLDMSKIENGNIMINAAPLSLPDLLENVVTIMQPNMKARDQRFSVHLQSIEHEQYQSDALRLRQILINLLSNASKFTPAKGEITLDIEEQPGADADSAILHILVSDNGIGMSSEYLEHLFEPFSREQDSRVDKTEGSGLGMAITKRLVNLLGGSITVASEVGTGTTFSVLLPMGIDNTPMDDFHFHFPNLKILVVDDSAVQQEYMDQALGEIGIQANCVDNGLTAVERAVQAHQKGADYDAVILDWKMPGLDGLETARRIRTQVKGVFPILIMSAYDWSEIEEPAKEAGISGFLQKPIFRSTLCYGIQKFVLGQMTSERETTSYDFTGKRFLLVEDNDINREIAMELLDQTGASVEAAINGKLGVEAYQNAPAHYYDLILMDIQMPVMDGLAATRTIRTLSKPDAKTIPILAMTADAFAEDVLAAKQAGMDDHLAKPINVEQLYRVIGDHLA